jgi:hypothetical protein
MANSDKNIKITPNISQTAQPNVVFTGQGNIPITLKVLDDSYGTLSFEGTAGQLFSVNNNLSTGVIFSVNDISGIPQIDVNADGTIRLAPFGTTLNVGGISGSAFTIQPSTRASTGAGANVTIAAGAGVTTGAGGSVILQPGAQATSGGNGTITFNSSAGTAISKFSTDSSTLTITTQSGAAFALKNSTGTTVLSVSSSFLALGADLDCSGVQLRNCGGLFQSGYAQFSIINPKIQFPSNTPTAAIENGSTGQIKVTDASTGGASFAFTSSTASYGANQNDLALTGSAFQRLSASGGVDRTITGIAPPTGGSHVDGRMIRIYNVGTANNLILAHNSASSTTTNRLWCVGQANITISSYDYAELIYDSNDNGRGGAGWRVH